MKRGRARAAKLLGSAYKEEGGALLAASARPGRQTLAPCREEGGASRCFGTPRWSDWAAPLKGGRVRLLLLRHAPTAKLWAAPPKGRGVRLAASARPRGQTLGSAPYREEGASSRPGGQTWGSAPYAVLV